MSKRCKDVSPEQRLRCTKERKHTRTELFPMHQNGDIVWKDCATPSFPPPLFNRHVLDDLTHGVPAPKHTHIDLRPFASKIDFTPSETAEDRFSSDHAAPMGLDSLLSPKMNLIFTGKTDDTKDWLDRLFGPKTEATEPPPLDPEQELRRWWHDQANNEIELTVPKAIEYGSTDLIDIGLMLARTMRRAVNEEEAAELGVFFYLIGKIARWQSAIERGERPSDDTLLDIGVYVRMAQRIRNSGGWPGAPKEETDSDGE